jgi:hypothetical protein
MEMSQSIPFFTLYAREYGSREWSNEVEVLCVSTSNETDRLTSLLQDLQALSSKAIKGP